MATRASRPPAQQPAYVLHRYDWSESSLILDLLTRDAGRLAVVAKGAKKPYSQLRGVLLPFQRLAVSLGRAGPDGAAEVQTLRGAEWAGGTAMPTGDALFSGFYLNELLMKLIARNDPHPALFDAYADTLPELAHGDDPAAEAALRAFELTLLHQTGVLPDLGLSTVTQQPVITDARYALRPDVGVVALADDDLGGVGSLAGSLLVGLQAALEHGSPAALRAACRPGLAVLKRPLRALIQHQLGDAALRTRRVRLGLQAL